MPLVRKRKKRSALRKFRWVLLLAGAAVVLLIGGSALTYLTEMDLFDATEERAKPAPVAAGPAEAPLTTAAEVAKATLARLGADAHREKFLGVRLLGTLAVGPRHYDFEMIKRAPNQVRLQISDARERLILGTDGSTPWMVRRLPSGVAQSWELDPEVGDWLWLLSAPGSWLLQPAGGTAPALELLSPPAGAEAAPAELLPMAARAPSGRSAVYFLDRTLLLPRTVELRAPDGAPIWTAAFEERKLEDGLSVPRQVTARRPGAPDVVLRVDKIQFNPGTLPQVFRKPTVDESFTLATSARPPGPITLAPPGTVAPGVRPTDYTSLPANRALTSRAVQRDVQSALSGPGMIVTNGTADTSLFVPSDPAAAAPPPLDGTAQNLLENYGFPWALPW